MGKETQLSHPLVGSLMAVVVCSAVGCGEQDAAEQQAQEQQEQADECEAHELRPSRYRLFEVVDSMTALTDGVEEPAEHSVYVIPNHWSPFWIAPQAGFDTAMAEVGFSGAFQPPCDKGDPDCVQAQKDLLAALTDGADDNGEADAIGLSPKDGHEMAGLVRDMVGEVPIITFDSDLTEPMTAGRHLYLGALNKPSGREAGETMFKFLPADGTAHLFGQDFSVVNVLERAAGVFEVCLDSTFSSAEDFAASEYCDDLESDNTCKADCVGEHSGLSIVAHAYASEMANDEEWRESNPDATPEDYLEYSFTELLNSDAPPVAVITLQGTPGSVVQTALANHELGGLVPFVAWDLSEEVQAGLDDGVVYAAIAQNAYFYGYVTAYISYAMAVVGVEPVMEALDEYFEPGAEDKLLDTGITVVTPQNLPFFLDYQVNCLGLSTA